MVVPITGRDGAAVAGAALAAVAALTLTPATAPALARTAAPAAKASASTPGCTASAVGAWVAADQGDGAAGTIYYPLEFTNLSGQSCSLNGFPGVSATDSSGHRLGSPARWDHAAQPQVVTLAPGATAHSVLAYSDVVVSNCPSASVRAAAELRIYPPGQLQATHAFWDLNACAVNGSAFLGVGPIQPGAGTR
jgi:hypothetical protein